ncbi:polyprotein [Plakobranchus ocellatus]|uniref:Polyprotein n=1 Tax=Plakobranchus ocellatus TaxID=259542 RepID=A0AAV3Y6A3_9GAST|nr:polyprotein [Plakobranchus ocellatus]
MASHNKVISGFLALRQARMLAAGIGSATVSLFQQPKSGTLTVEREELETHLKKTYSNPTREIPLEETTGLVWPAAPGIKFDSKPPTLQEVIAIVNKARAKSAPGPNGVPYLLYKK